MKKILTLAMLLATFSVARAFSFSLDTPQGQRLYYTVLTANTVKLVAPGGSDGWDGYNDPQGRLTIPAAVTHDGTTYSVTAIDNSAFKDCDRITSVSVPASVTTIGALAFANDSAMTSLFIEEGLTNIDRLAFHMCSSLDTIQLPSTLTRIAMQAFYGTAYYRNADNWSASLVLAIGDWVVSVANTVAGEVLVPEHVTGIANNAFYGCRYMDGVELPENLRYIGEAAFQGCSELDTVRMRASVPPALADDAFQGVNTAVKVPCGSLQVYQNAQYWNALTLVEATCPIAVEQVEQPAQLTVVAVADGVEVAHAEGCGMELYDMAGRCQMVVRTASERQLLRLPATGVYVLRLSDGRTAKVVYSK